MQESETTTKKKMVGDDDDENDSYWQPRAIAKKARDWKEVSLYYI